MVCWLGFAGGEFKSFDTSESDFSAENRVTKKDIRPVAKIKRVRNAKTVPIPKMAKLIPWLIKLSILNDPRTVCAEMILKPKLISEQLGSKCTVIENQRLNLLNMQRRGCR